FLNLRRLFAYGKKLLTEFDVRGGNERTRASALSGGNQQKVVIAREVSRDPRVLIAAQPTRGLDVGAIEFVHRRLVEERDEGRAVLLVSLELEEVVSLADPILVTTLICTGLAVAFAFRCGLFNIGGQGQYMSGAIVSVWVGSSWAGMAKGLHVTLAIALAMLAGAAIAGIAGFLKATVGAHEV